MTKPIFTCKPVNVPVTTAMEETAVSILANALAAVTHASDPPIGNAQNAHPTLSGRTEHVSVIIQAAST